VTVITGATGQADGAFEVHACIKKWNAAGVLRAARAVHAIGPDVVFIQYPTHGYGRRPGIALLPLLLRGCVPRTTVAAVVHEFGNKTWLGKARGLFLFLMCHRLIVVDPSFSDAIARWFAPLRKRCRHIPVGATVSRYALEPGCVESLRARYGIGANIPVVCCFGVIRRSKGLETLLDAFARFLMSFPDARLLMLGHAVEPYCGTVFDPHVRKLGIDRSVIRVGRCLHAELSAHFSLAWMCVLPYEEGFSPRRGSFMAALEHDVPVITTTPRRADSGLRHGHNVLLAPPGRADALCDQMIALASDELLRSTIREHAAGLRRSFTWNSIAARMLSALDAQTSETGSPGDSA